MSSDDDVQPGIPNNQGEQAEVDYYLENDIDDLEVANFNTQVVHVGHSDNQVWKCFSSLRIPSVYKHAILDNGANTCVIGKGWTIMSSHPIRKANVIGFDKQAAIKTDLPIVTAVTMVDTGEQNILLQVNEAVYNEDADHSLLSEYQMRDFGTIVESTPNKHGGKQQLSVGDLEIKLGLNNCLVHFIHRTPTDHELATGILHSITRGGIPWNPYHQDHTDGIANSFANDVAKTWNSQEPVPRVERPIIPESSVMANSMQIQGMDSEPTAGINQPHLHRAVPKKVDYERLAPFFLYKTKDVIRKTLENTMQLVSLQQNTPMKRHLQSYTQMLKFPRRNEIVATDTYFLAVKSFDGYHCAQIFIGLTSRRREVYGMKSKSEFPDIYQDFLRQHGIPHTLRRDNAKEENSTAVRDINRKFVVADEFTEPHSPWQNPAENSGVRIIKATADTLMNRTGAPTFLWYHCHKYICYVTNRIANPKLNWKTPMEISTGETPDISSILQFHFYQAVLYLDPTTSFPDNKELPGYFVGIAEGAGDALTFEILTEDHKSILTRSVVRAAQDHAKPNRRVSFQDIPTVYPTVSDPHTHLEGVNQGPKVQDLEHATGTSFTADSQGSIWKDPKQGMETATRAQEPNSEGNVASRTRSRTHLVNTMNVVPDQVIQQNDMAKWLLRAIPTLTFFVLISPVPSQFACASSKSTVLDIGEDEKLEYESTLQNCSKSQMGQLKYIQTVDAIAESNNPKEYQNLLWNVDQVIDHCIVHKGTKKKVLVNCRFKGTSNVAHWIDMFALAMQDPIPILRYARKKHLLKQDPFNKLVKYCSGDAPSQLARAFKAQTRPGGPKFKFGVQVPVGVKQAWQLDKVNGNSNWREAIQLEINQLNEFQVFTMLEPGEELDPAYKQVPYHIVFDVKFDLRCKAWLVADGNWTDLVCEDIYSGVVAMDTVRLGFLIGDMNQLKCCAGDVGNAFLNGYTREKLYIIAGPEFGPEAQGKTLIIVRSIYGLRTSAARFHEQLTDVLRALGFQQSKADPNFFVKDKGTHYEYLASYVDDILVWSKQPMAVMDKLKEIYTMKGVGVPEYYLGGNVEYLDEHWAKDGKFVALSAKTYIQNVIPKFEELLGETFRAIKTPMEENYHPETDDSPLLDSENASKFRSIIGSINWIITLGRFDVNYAFMSLSRFNMAPREGHMTAACCILRYLKTFSKGQIVLDHSYPDHAQLDVQDHDTWREFYPDASEEIPHDMLDPKGKPVRMTVYVDADHAHDLVTRRSVTGIILMLNNTPVRWVSKRQKTVESSTYGSELVAARIATELILEMRYTLRMIGVPLEGPAMLLGDNMSVVLNTTVPSSVLKKKHCAIGYHRVQEAIAGKVIKFAHIRSEKNIADIMTKPLGNRTFYSLVKPILFQTPSHVCKEMLDTNTS